MGNSLRAEQGPGLLMKWTESRSLHILCALRLRHLAFGISGWETGQALSLEGGQTEVGGEDKE